MNDDFLDLLSALLDADVRFMVVGASRPGAGFMMGIPPRRIDILTQVSGIAFEEAWPKKRRERIEIRASGTVAVAVDGLRPGA